MGYVDVMPTLLKIVGVKDTPKNPFDGINVLALLQGRVSSMDRFCIWGMGL